MRPAGRALIGLWAALLLVAGGGAAVLQLLGPPKSPPVRAMQAASVPARPTPSPPSAVQVATDAAPAPVAPPDPALLEPAPDLADRMLPRIGADGRTPSHAYASHAGLPARGPQVAILLEGLGLHDEYSRDAIARLPAAISLAVSPYAGALDHAGPYSLLEAARAAGHETWLSLPMEPAGSPLDDEGAQALRTGIEYDKDRTLLTWSLSRFQGYVGVTNALSGLRGDRFASSSAFGIVTGELAARGLLYVDAGTAPQAETMASPPPGIRRADLTIDEAADAPDIEARLSRLEEIAERRGSALGVAGPLRPVTIERLHAWSRHLALRGITLVPVSALPPQRPMRVLPVDASGSPGLATGPVDGPATVQPVTALPADGSAGAMSGVSPAAASGAPPAPSSLRPPAAPPAAAPATTAAPVTAATTAGGPVGPIPTMPPGPATVRPAPSGSTRASPP